MGALLSRGSFTFDGLNVRGMRAPRADNISQLLLPLSRTPQANINGIENGSSRPLEYCVSRYARSEEPDQARHRIPSLDVWTATLRRRQDVRPLEAKTSAFQDHARAVPQQRAP